jgi:signal transduction histidine kinase
MVHAAKTPFFISLYSSGQQSARLICIFVWFIFSISIIVEAKGQTSELDSLRKQLALTKQDTAKVIIMASMIDRFGFIGSDSCFPYAQKALAIAQKANYLYGQYLVYSRLFTVYNMSGDYAGALQTMNQSLKVAEKLTDRRLETMADVYGQIGNINYEMEKYSDALGSNWKSIELRKEAALPQTKLASIYINIGYCLAKLNQLDSAKYWADSGYALHLEAKSHWAMSLTNYGRTQEAIGNESLAENAYQDAIRNYYSKPQHDNSYFVCAPFIDLARLLFKLNKYDSSIYFADVAYQISKRNNFPEYVLGAATVLSEVYKAKMNTDSAAKYMSAVIETNKNILSRSRIQKFESVQFAEEQRKAEILAAELKLKNQVRLYCSLAGLLVFLIIAFILFRNNQQKKKANAQLRAQKVEIENALSTVKTTQKQLIQSEKMASLGELTAGIAHEIQNPLNFVNNFSELNGELLEEMQKELKAGNQDEAISLADHVIQNMQKINQHGKRAEGIVSGMLQHSRPSAGERQLTDINALAEEYLRLSLHGMKAKDNLFECKVTTVLDSSIEKMNVIPQDLGRVFLNIYNNAFYSLGEKMKKQPTGFEPVLFVSTKKSDHKAEIFIRDNGMGIAQKNIDKVFQPFFTTKPTGQGTGLGLSLAYDIITKEHEGTLGVETAEGEFAEFMIQLPDKENTNIQK